MSMLTGSKEPRFRLRIVGKEALMKDVADEVEREIRAKIEDVAIYVGSL